MPMIDAFRMADQVLYQGVDGIVADHDARPDQPRLRRREVDHGRRGLGLMGIGLGTGRIERPRPRRPRSARRCSSPRSTGEGGPALDRRPDRPDAPRGQRGRRRDHAGGPPRRQHHLRRGRRRRARRRGPGHRRRRRLRQGDAGRGQPFESRLSRLLEEPGEAGAEEPLPSILAEDDEDRVFTDGEEAPAVSFDAEEDLKIDIPDFLKS